MGYYVILHVWYKQHGLVSHLIHYPDNNSEQMEFYIDLLYNIY